MGVAQKMMREGTFERVFYEGNVRNPFDFLELMQSQNNLPVFIFRGIEPITVGWLNGAIGKRAFAHFCVMSSAWGRDSLQACRLGLKFWMSFQAHGEPVFDVLIGVIPEANPQAIAFAQRVGFTKLGSVPGMVVYQGDRVAAAILYYSRFPNG